MSKLTNKQLNALNEIARQIDRALAFVQRDDISVARREKAVYVNALHFTRTLSEPAKEALLSDADKARGDYALYELNKFYGTDLCGLADAKRLINDFIKMND